MSANGNEVEHVKRVVHADPTKDFFVSMITRDIAIHDCIFDLLDNSIDGARRSIAGQPVGRWLEPYRIDIGFSRDSFSIRDNCGGISLDDAVNYAFHFGRRPDAPADVAGGIGLYGIGMKRAIFKMGTLAKVTSHHRSGSFSVSVDVAEWLNREDWDFEYEDAAPVAQFGTDIEVDRVHASIGSVFADPAFALELLSRIARDYAFFLAHGLKVCVAGREVPVHNYELKSSEQLKPAVVRYDDEGVRVRIAAGLMQELSEEIPDDVLPSAVERSGWFVVCNDRIVLAGDKTERTVWGDDGFNAWHPQYNGFAGFVFFESDDQRRLPWTTTKRDLDYATPVYRRAVAKMKELTRSIIAYTNQRKGDAEAAKRAEASAAKVDITHLTQDQALVVPPIQGERLRPNRVTINYTRPRSEVEQLKRHIGDPGMSARDVGQFTYDYYWRMELGE